MKTLAERVRSALDEKGATQAELARAAGVKSPSVSNWLSGETKQLKGPSLVKAAAFLGVNEAWLSEGKGPRHLAGRATQEQKDEAGVELEPAGQPRSVRRIRVVGTAKLGDDGYFERIEGDGWIIGYTDDQDAYALRVKGDSMHPAIRHGHFVAVAPNSCCVPGEYVVIELRDGRKMVKELIFERSDEIVIESVNGNHRRAIEKSEIEKMHPVVAIVPPSRWRPD
jgi:phage repressor protein C with HTH and peptisase S24 domain